MKNLIGSFRAIYVVIVYAKLQASSFTGVGGEWGDGHMRDVTPDPYTKFLNSHPFASLQEGYNIFP